MNEPEPMPDSSDGATGCGDRKFDELAERVCEILGDARVERTGYVYQFTSDDPGGVVVVITPEAIESRLPTVDWPHPGVPVASSRLWKRQALDRLSDEALAELLRAAVDARHQETKPCVFCGRPTPPEHAHSIDDKWVCHGCSERELGVVH